MGKNISNTMKLTVGTHFITIQHNDSTVQHYYFFSGLDMVLL